MTTTEKLRNFGSKARSAAIAVGIPVAFVGGVWHTINYMVYHNAQARNGDTLYFSDIDFNLLNPTKHTYLKVDLDSDWSVVHKEHGLFQPRMSFYNNDNDPEVEKVRITEPFYKNRMLVSQEYTREEHLNDFPEIFKHADREYKATLDRFGVKL